jgi:cytochrome c5
MAFALVTKSLLFVSVADQGKSLLRVLDKKTGASIHDFELPGYAFGAPMTYMANGRQFISLASGAGDTAQLVTLALPMTLIQTISDAAGQPPAGQSQEAPQQNANRSAASIYQTNCGGCHDNGTAGAPRPHVEADWSFRLANGVEDVYLNVLDGVGPQMPPRGLCYDCTDAELRTVVDFMISQPE